VQKKQRVIKKFVSFFQLFNCLLFNTVFGFSVFHVFINTTKTIPNNSITIIDNNVNIYGMGFALKNNSCKFVILKMKNGISGKI